jgi:pimeloyl-ACP methyl ester carboxylesterase
MGAREVRIDGGGCRLAGTYVPVSAPVAAALLIPGPGQTDRDSDSRLPTGQRLHGGITRELAHALAAAHVANLRYDKRGVGASEGDFWATGMTERLADASRALDWLAAAHDVGRPLLVIGHSEGTYYAAQFAARERVDGVALLCAPARTGTELLAWQRTRQRTTRFTPVARLALRLLRPDAARLKPESLDRALYCGDDSVRLQGRRVNARWLREFAAYDPAAVLGRVTVPVLALTGGHDVEVPPEDVQAIGRLVRGPFEGHVLDGLNHLLRPDPAHLGARGYLRSLREPVSPEVTALVCDWVGRHWGRG